MYSTFTNKRIEINYDDFEVISINDFKSRLKCDIEIIEKEYPNFYSVFMHDHYLDRTWYKSRLITVYRSEYASMNFSTYRPKNLYNLLNTVFNHCRGKISTKRARCVSYTDEFLIALVKFGIVYNEIQKLYYNIVPDTACIGILCWDGFNSPEYVWLQLYNLERVAYTNDVHPKLNKFKYILVDKSGCYIYKYVFPMNSSSMLGRDNAKYTIYGRMYADWCGDVNLDRKYAVSDCEYITNLPVTIAIQDCVDLKRELFHVYKNCTGLECTRSAISVIRKYLPDDIALYGNLSRSYFKHCYETAPCNTSLKKLSSWSYVQPRCFDRDDYAAAVQLLY